MLVELTAAAPSPSSTVYSGVPFTTGGANYQVPALALLYVVHLAIEVTPFDNAANHRCDFGYNTANSSSTAGFTLLKPIGAGAKFVMSGSHGSPIAIIPAGMWPQIAENLIATSSDILAHLVGYVE